MARVTGWFDLFAALLDVAMSLVIGLGYLILAVLGIAFLIWFVTSGAAPDTVAAIFFVFAQIIAAVWGAIETIGHAGLVVSTTAGAKLRSITISGIALILLPFFLLGSVFTDPEERETKSDGDVLSVNRRNYWPQASNDDDTSSADDSHGSVSDIPPGATVNEEGDIVYPHEME